VVKAVKIRPNGGQDVQEVLVGPFGSYSARIMVSRPAARLLTTARIASDSVNTFVRRQFITRNRRLAALLAVWAVAVGVAGVHVSAWWFSPGVIILPILAGGLLLRVRALRILFCIVAVVIAYEVTAGRAGPGIVATIAIVAVLADALARTREKLGVRGLRGDQMLVELRDRLRAQGRLAALPEGWGSKVVLEPADGSSFGGDFVVSAYDGKTLELALVDVSGRGIDAGTRALLLSGAFGGLLGSVPTEEFLGACNAYLRRGSTAEGFVTAIHLTLDLMTGEYVLYSAGHPPAAQFDAGNGQWRITQAKGIVLGVVADLRCKPERGVLRPGDALLLYTDGLVEAPGRDIDAGIDRLLGEADRLVTSGFQRGAAELVRAMKTAHVDDCALVLIWRA